ncbi:MAG: RNA methyltransferase [Mesorhizobium sp.]
MQPIRIVDADDPRIAAYRELRERDLVGRQGRFVAEGKVVLDILLRGSRFVPESVLVLESRLPGLADILGRAPAELPVYVADTALLQAVAGFHVHRGILAIGRSPAPETVDGALSALPQRAIVLALVGISNHDNMGGLFRNAAAFGAGAVLLDGTCCDPLYRKAIRVSVGAVLTMPFAAAADVDALGAALARHGFSGLALSPSGTVDIRDVDRCDRMALYLGTEGTGLPASVLATMTTARIAMRPGFDSLNVATASAIALHRLHEGMDLV